ncbi:MULTISPECIES: S8 family serine peptidase [unclassified Streptomyces]|uniref:S8 family serine peptidase n=1 Tax=unclassified Streptomyces TaxID=2593676 RepID=UPI0011E701AA|nr:S8 family serine peptidase [Streptomyces sp. sk2.1]TXS75163.1 peptidase S8/S53 subtilisin kexin sedolisin [Streptomyces sp. sk2.1]
MPGFTRSRSSSKKVITLMRRPRPTEPTRTPTSPAASVAHPLTRRPVRTVLGLLTAACAAGTLSILPVATAAETSASRAARPQQDSPVVATHELTLVTGEVVTLERRANGFQAATVEPATDGVPAAFTSMKVGDEVYVIPDKAQPYLAANELDRELFNVTKLVEYGYDDAHRPVVPLIATYGGAPGKAGKALERDAPAGSVKKDELPSANAVALHAGKKKAATFWEAVDDDSTAATKAPKLAGGIKKLWLDKPVRVALDRSVPQIGAPEAWAAGYDGTGTKVAVLDTGIDPDHPDVAGRVKKAQNFTDDPDTVDHHGHGTHVASTIAGSGAASGGRLKGVAPGADLYIGKVLDTAGSGSESGVIGGMEWAAAQGADVISMSLGGSVPSDGTDPISQAVDQLTESSGSLFVIAAGNEGPGKGTVSSPGAAEDALTVGAVSKQDQLANFSSRGPVKETFAVKPEITAPGVGIVAARAAGTSMGTPVDADYTSANGTSMATPHVSGAAAILAQRHPDWSADRLKQVLVSTAEQGSYSAYQGGNGRVDVPRAIDATVYSSPAVVSMGKKSAESAPVTRTVDYINTSATDTTLSLRLFGAGETAPPPDGMFTLSANSVTIPANSTASVTVTYHPELGAVGDYTGVITATAVDGTAIRTTVGATKDVPTVDLTLNTIDRNGDPANGELVVFDLDNGVAQQVFPQGGTKTVAVPQGRYSVMGLVYTKDKATGIAVSNTLAGEPMVDLKADRTITMDARLGKEVKVSTPKESQSSQYKLGYRQQLPGKRGVDYMKGTSSLFAKHAYAVPTEPVTDGTFEFNFQDRRYSPVIRASYAGRGGPLPLTPVTYAARLYGSSKLQAVDAGTGRPEDLAGKDLDGRIAVVTRDATLKVVDQIAAAAGAGAKAAVVVNDRPGVYATIVPRATGTAIPAWSLTQDEGAVLFGRMADGPTRINLQGIKKNPYVYNIALMVPGGIPADPTDTVTAGNSAMVKAHYRSTRGTLIGDTTSAIRPGESFITQLVDFFDAPTDREEWYSTGSKWPAMKDMGWWHTVYPDRKDIVTGMRDLIRNYGPGERREETWLGAVNGPPGPESTLAFRDGDKVTLNMQEMSDSQPGHYAYFQGDNGTTSTVRLYQDGELLKEQGWFTLTTLPVDPDPATYRITMDTTHPEWFPLSTEVGTAWTFKSARPANGKEDLALLWPRYGLDLDAENTTRGGRNYQFDLSFVLQNGAAPDIDEVEVETSADDGATWQPAKVGNRSDGGYKVSVRNPDSGHVSLRIKAQDTDGSRIEQTLIKAYAVR